MHESIDPAEPFHGGIAYAERAIGRSNVLGQNQHLRAAVLHPADRGGRARGGGTGQARTGHQHKPGPYSGGQVLSQREPDAAQASGDHVHAVFAQARATRHLGDRGNLLIGQPPAVPRPQRDLAGPASFPSGPIG